MRCLSDVGEDISDGEWDNTRTGHGSLHGKRLSSSRHAVGKHCSMITFHHSAYQSFRCGVVDLCIVIGCGENVVEMVISAFFPAVGDKTSASIDHPFSFRLSIVLSTSI